MWNTVSDEEIKALMEAIRNRYDLDFTNYEIKSLKRGVVRLMMKRKMTSILELWSKVLKDREFFLLTIDDLMVNLTELFRNPDAWVIIKDQILPKFASDRHLNIWHAGCSTGEEVYTMAFVLDEVNMLEKTNRLATDLSSKVLAKAQKADYSLIVMQNYLAPFLKFFPKRKMEDFFDYNALSAVVKDKYRKGITFKNHNLVHDSAFSQHYQVVFCRNVMIYFDEQLKIEVLKLLHKSIKPGGFLIIGYYDIMPDYGKQLFEAYDLGTKIYRKI